MDEHTPVRHKSLIPKWQQHRILGSVCNSEGPNILFTKHT